MLKKRHSISLFSRLKTAFVFKGDCGKFISRKFVSSLYHGSQTDVPTYRNIRIEVIIYQRLSLINNNNYNNNNNDEVDDTNHFS